MDLSTFEELVANGVLYYQITIDGEEESHNKLRPLANGHPTYDRIISNIISIKKFSKSRHFRITIRSNVGETSFARYSLFLEDLKRQLGNDRRFIFNCEKIIDWGGDGLERIRDDLMIEQGIYFAYLSNKYVAIN